MPNLFPTRYITFDIETAKVLPEGASEILAYRSLGVCAAEERRHYISPLSAVYAQHTVGLMA